jgi:small multidrug resistance family-3 protein
MQTLAVYILAAFAEIAGTFAFWVWLRRAGSVLWLIPGLVSLVLFAWLLTLSEAEFAGRAYAAYGGIYIASSLVWLWAIEGIRPTHWDLLGAALAVLGAIVILIGGALSARAVS